MTLEETTAAQGPDHPRWPLVAVALAWTVLTPFLVGIVAALVSIAEIATGRGVVNGNQLVSTAIETVVYLVASFGVFRMARGFGARSWYWLAGPAGYLLGAAGYVLLGMVVGGAAVPGAPVTVILADTAGCALGAYAGTRAGAGRSDGDTGLEEASS